MSVRNEVESYITDNWQDKRVAGWVIGSLALLEKGFTYPPCPIFNLSFEHGLVKKHGIPTDDTFRGSRKIVMSGGFEGTKGHMHAVAEMREVRALTADIDTPLVLMLEPDSYITQLKRRNPIVNISQREQLWSTSGLIDVIILLPEKKSEVSDEEHYKHIYKCIAPAVWCANVDNPHRLEIITRMQEEDEALDIIRIFKHGPQLHTSFVNSTKDLTAEEVKKTIYPYFLNLCKNPEIYNVPHSTTPEEIAKIIAERVVNGLF